MVGEFARTVAAAGLILLVSLPIGLGIGSGIRAYQCSAYGELMGFETRYIFLDRCYVKVGDRYEVAPRW